jgi:hypothetical protein
MSRTGFALEEKRLRVPDGIEQALDPASQSTDTHVRSSADQMGRC